MISTLNSNDSTSHGGCGGNDETDPNQPDGAAEDVKLTNRGFLDILYFPEISLRLFPPLLFFALACPRLLLAIAGKNLDVP